MAGSIVDVATTPVLLISNGTAGVDRTMFSAHSLATHNSLSPRLDWLVVLQRLRLLHFLSNPAALGL